MEPKYATTWMTLLYTLAKLIRIPVFMDPEKLKLLMNKLRYVPI